MSKDTTKKHCKKIWSHPGPNTKENRNRKLDYTIEEEKGSWETVWFGFTDSASEITGSSKATCQKLPPSQDAKCCLVTMASLHAQLDQWAPLYPPSLWHCLPSFCPDPIFMLPRALPATSYFIFMSTKCSKVLEKSQLWLGNNFMPTLLTDESESLTWLMTDSGHFVELWDKQPVL